MGVQSPVWPTGVGRGDRVCGRTPRLEGGTAAQVGPDLPSAARGLRDVRGIFEQGDAVEICDLEGHAIARGLAGYSSDDLKRISGHRSADIESLLGYKFLDEAVHKDDLVLLSEAAGGR